MTNVPKNQDEIDRFTKIVHLGLAVFGLLAWATGGIADDYKTTGNFGFYFHGVIGLIVVFFVTPYRSGCYSCHNRESFVEKNGVYQVIH